MVDPSSFGKRTTALEVCQAFPESIRGRTIILTGPTVTGVGYATAEAIAKLEPGLLILAGRSIPKLEEAKEKIIGEVPEAKLQLLQIDLSSLASVRKAAEEINKWGKPIDILINNAAVMDTPYTVTPEGHELQFVTNYLGHWLFTLSILPLILQSQGKRVVHVSSSGHANGKPRWDDPAFKNGYDKKEAYGQGKTANILFTRELVKRYGSQGLVAFSLDPGGISTPLQQHWSLEEKQDIGRKYGAYHEDGKVNTESEIWKTPAQGASTTARAAFDPDLKPNGSYLVDCQVAEDKCKDYAKDSHNAERLWSWTNELIGEKF